MNATVVAAASRSGSELQACADSRRDHAPQPVSAAAPDFAGDHFALFGLPQRFDLDIEALGQAWRRLQALVHPDRFAGAGAAQARLAMQWSTLVNTAYRTLLDPLTRAAYLCRLRGAEVDAECNTAMPVEFLEEQMEWREQFDEARAGGDAAALRELQARVEQRRSQVLQRIAGALDSAPAEPRLRACATCQAGSEVRVLMFIDKFRRDLAAQRSRKPADPGA